MAKLTVKGVPPLDGDYPLDVSTFTNRELHTIKEVSGVRAGELKAAMEAADNDLVVAFAIIVVRRAGKTVDPEQFWEADVGAITVDLTDEEAAERPPASASPSGNENRPGDTDEPNGGTAPSGSPSINDGDPPANGRSLIGLPGSDTSAISDRETLAS